MPQPPNTAKQLQIRPNIATLHRNFKMLVRCMAKHTFQPRQLAAFTNNATSSYRLNSIGYMHSTPTLAGLPTSTTALDIATTAALLAIKKGRTPSHAAIAEGIARTSFGKLHNAAQPGWRAHMPEAPHANTDPPVATPQTDSAPRPGPTGTGRRATTAAHAAQLLTGDESATKRKRTAAAPPPSTPESANSAVPTRPRKRKSTEVEGEAQQPNRPAHRPQETQVPHPLDHLPMEYTAICNVPHCSQRHMHSRLPRQDFFPTGWVQVYCVTTQHSSWIGDHTCQQCRRLVPQCECIAAIPQPATSPASLRASRTTSPQTHASQPLPATRGTKRLHEPASQVTARGARKPNPKARHESATQERPYVTICAYINGENEPCLQHHAHLHKLIVKHKSAALKDFYCWKCKAQRSLTTHTCAGCHHIIGACACTIHTDTNTAQRTSVVQRSTPMQSPPCRTEIASDSASAPQYTSPTTLGLQQPTVALVHHGPSPGSTAPAPTPRKRKRPLQDDETPGDAPGTSDPAHQTGEAPAPTPSPRIKRQRTTEITARHPYGTLCDTLRCRQPHSHTVKPVREPNSIHWLNFYCFQCQVSARMGNHVCRHCHQILDSCNCEVVPIDGGAAQHVVQRTQALPWAAHTAPVAGHEPVLAPIVDFVPLTGAPCAPLPRAQPRARPRPQGTNVRAWLGLNAAPPAQRIFATRARGRRPTNLRPLTLGTDCSGMDAVAHAIKGFQIPLAHVFASDPEQAAQDHMRANHNIQHLYQFLHERPMTHTNLDVYAAGPPCQPFSGIGLQKGLDDPRAALYQQTIEFIRQARPKIFLIENVPGLQSFDKGVHLGNLIALLSNSKTPASRLTYHGNHAALLP